MCVWLAFGAATAAEAAATDCRKAVSASEKAVCHDPKLRRADALMSAMFDRLREAAQGRPRSELVADQRRLVSRMAACDGASACLETAIAERTAVLQALAARLSKANPGLPDVTAVVLLGHWRTGATRMLDPGKGAPATVLDDGVPEAERDIVGKPGVLCMPHCGVFGLEPLRLDASAEGRQAAQLLGLDATARAYLVYRDGRASFRLVPLTNGHVAALVIGCRSDMLNCGPAIQDWTPVDAEATLKILTP